MNLPLGLAGRVLTGSGKEYTKTNTKHFTLVCQCKLFVIMCFLDFFLFYMNNKGGGLKPNRIFPLIVVLQTASFFLEFHLKCKVHVENQYLLEKLKTSIAKLCGKEEGGGGLAYLSFGLTPFPLSYPSLLLRKLMGFLKKNHCLVPRLPLAK